MLTVRHRAGGAEGSAPSPRRSRLRLGFAFALFSAAVLTAACGGHGGVASAPFAVTAIGAPVPGSSASGVAVITIPNTRTASAGRNAKYVPASASSLGIAIGAGTPTFADVSSGSAACTTSGSSRTCNVAFTSPSGTQSINFTLYDQPSGQGNQLAGGSVTQNVLGGVPFTVTVPLSGIVNNVVFGIVPTISQNGGATSVPIGITPLDADKNAINDPNPFAVPITVSLSDTTGALSLSLNGSTCPSTVVGVGSRCMLNSYADTQAVTLGYKGSTLQTAAVISAAWGAKNGATAQSQAIGPFFAGNGASKSVPVSPTSLPVSITSAAAPNGASGALSFKMTSTTATTVTLGTLATPPPGVVALSGKRAIAAYGASSTVQVLYFYFADPVVLAAYPTITFTLPSSGTLPAGPYLLELFDTAGNLLTTMQQVVQGSSDLTFAPTTIAPFTVANRLSPFYAVLIAGSAYVQTIPIQPQPAASVPFPGPSAAGYTWGTISIPGATGASNGSITAIGSKDPPPGGVPALVPSASQGIDSTLYYVNLIVTGTANYAGTNTTSLVVNLPTPLPAVSPGLTPQYYLAGYDARFPSSGWYLGLVGPAQPNGNQLTFTSTKAVSFSSGQYALALYQSHADAPLPQQVVAVQAQPTTVPLPAVGSVTGTLSLPAAVSPSGTLVLNASLTVPSSAPSPPASWTPLYFVSLNVYGTSNGDVTYTGATAPATNLTVAVTLPSPLPTVSPGLTPQYWIGAYGANNLTAGWTQAILGPGVVSGSTVTFKGAPFGPLSSGQYGIAVYQTAK